MSFQMGKAANLQPHAAEAFAVSHPLIHAAKSSYFNVSGVFGSASIYVLAYLVFLGGLLALLT